MRVNPRFINAGAIFVIAFSTGYVMQNADALAARFGGNDKPDQVRLDTTAQVEADIAAPLAELSEEEPLVPVEPAVAALGRPATQAYASRLAELLPEPEPEPEPAPLCEASLTAKAKPSAMLALEITAPCEAGKRVEIRHEALVFAETLDSSGKLQIQMPVLREAAHVTAQFSDGQVLATSAVIPDLAEFERIGLQWQGETGVELHAFEFGAARGHPGHIHAGNPRSPRRAELLGAGFMVKLGSAQDGPQAEIYSFPAADAQYEGMVRMSVELAVSEANCGREIQAQALRAATDGEIEPMDLSLSVPACDSVGEFLVLNNLLRDMSIAAN
ncbi:hypothetical protein [Aliiruegeria lutimaris]|uniref:Translocase n=1 Tax=Aliiruegeria lutimaris TaxID=571298 RepID=A0A1G8NKJ1_9RHOB|nr:hypothetical protein [Aliiruegeria lutimaris]SDI80733.1 hypothetical protein SAMN04488026_100788 [Aliiruegeria lutimaris]